MVAAGYPEKAARVADAAEKRAMTPSDRAVIERFLQGMYKRVPIATTCPTELLVRIFSYLESRDLESAMLTCHWCRWAAEGNIEVIAIEATESKHGRHAWLSKPMQLQGRIKSLKLVGTPPLDTDEGTLQVMSQLESFVYGTGPSYGGARAARERHSESLGRLIRAGAPSLRVLELDGEAIWALDFFPVRTGKHVFPRLTRLKAPLRSVAPEATGNSTLFPALQELETQVSPSRAPGASPTALLSFARSTRELQRLCIRGLSDTPSWLADSLLRIWKRVDQLEFKADEEVYQAAPISHETRQSLLARPLGASTLVRLLVPTKKPDDSVDVLLPQLHTLAFGADTTIRGPELVELVRSRHDKEYVPPLGLLNIDLH
ncbi:hypothetical protein MCUN1_001596 [Malassezia cuniculi]|uniref:F-box domain-containing protein n=1 Tax=Malassezia cuniculi TaxID=948313 RepID=A0AAF0J5R2_9BASI|nr:hypothetical protein MCUN1_001596 [Malassezia cuniculi]